MGAAFWIPGFRRAGGHFPVPLDDVYIHFGFARSAALGHPFAWIPENGYSSGGTSLIWPLVLAPGWLVGFRGERLAWFAAVLACLAVIDLARSLRRLLAPRWITWAAPLLVLAVPLLDWSLFSGMETAVFAAILGRTLVAVREAERAPPARRAAMQLRAGVWSAILVASRPEAAPLALLLGLAVVHAAGSLRTVPSMARAFGPTFAFLAAQAAANRAFTGEWSAAGAVRKLVTTNPYTTSLDAAIEVIKNLAALRAQAFESALGGPRVAWILPLLGLVAALDRRTRRLALPLLLGAVAALGLVSLNTTARFQNLRYATPSLLMLIVAAALGASALAHRGRAGGALAAVALAVAVLAPAGAFHRQIDHFARASANIAAQQVETAYRLAARVPQPRRVLVGDAGAIPYLSGLGALDGLGLGGYHDLPFARASVHGVPAVIELIERLPTAERPDVFALYPSWWPGLADVFGHRTDGVRITDNVICGADEKVIYDADWSTLAPADEHRADAVDEIDIADLVDERTHDYAFPKPRGGWVIGATLPLADGRKRFDAGRIIPEGKLESFTIRSDVAAPTALVLRTDGGAELALRVIVTRADRTILERDAVVPPRDEGRWHEARVPLGDVRRGDRVQVLAIHGALRDYHAWIVRDVGLGKTR
ncbi:Hypothetical protein A7982_07355 [Minicystis rosea]|nr:Hypothetical protein A7982_07355 [Minicystis rosea]